MLGVMHNFDLTCEAFCLMYRNSPSLNVDLDVIGANIKQHTSEECKEEDLQNEPSEAASFGDLPSKIYPTRSKASSCTETFQQIKSLTYMIPDNDALDTLEEDLVVILKELQSKTFVDSGLVVETDTKKKEQNTTQ